MDWPAEAAGCDGVSEGDPDLPAAAGCDGHGSTPPEKRTRLAYRAIQALRENCPDAAPVVVWASDLEGV
jgi:hypothetical protein